MRFGRFHPVWGGVLCASVLLAGAVTAAADTVGAVQVVKRNVYGKPPEANETPKHPGNPVVYRETIKTLSDSAALIRFDDGSELTVGAKSVVQLDEFVYDPKTNTGKALLSVSGGAIRFVTGSMPKGNTTIVTPTATMVLRGTEVTVQVSPDGTTTLNVVSGNVDTTASGTKDKTNVPPGHSVKIGKSGFSGGTGGSQPGNQPQSGPDDLGGDTETGDDAVDSGLGDGPDGNDGREIKSGEAPKQTTPGDSFVGGGNQNAGSGHGNNGNL